VSVARRMRWLLVERYADAANLSAGCLTESTKRKVTAWRKRKFFNSNVVVIFSFLKANECSAQKVV
jgi:hypothetical protein